MATEQQLPDIHQKIVFEYEENVQSQALGKYFKQLIAQMNAMNKGMERYKKQFSAYDSQAKKHISTLQDQVKSWTQISTAQAAATDQIRDYAKGLSLANRQTDKLHSTTQNLSRSFKSMLGFIGLSSAAYAGFRRLQDNVDKRFTLALMGGQKSISEIRALTGGKGMQSMISLAAKFQQQSPYNRFSLGSDSFAGLNQLRKAFAPIGNDMAEQLILDITKEMEPAGLKRFLDTAKTGNIEMALLRGANASNVESITSGLNALQLTQSDIKEIDPMLKAAMEFTEASHRIQDSFDKLADQLVKDLSPTIKTLTEWIEKLTGAIDGISPGKLLAGAAGAYVGLKTLPAIGRGLWNATKWGVGKIPSPFGGGGVVSPATGPVSVTAWRTVDTGQKMLPMLGPATETPAIGTTALGPAGAAAAGGISAGWLALPAAMAVAGGLAGRHINKQTIGHLETAQALNANAPLGQMAFDQNAAAKTELDRLKARRMQLVGVIGQNPMASDVDRKNLETLQEQLRSLNAQIDKLRPSGGGKGTSITGKFFEVIKTGAAYAKSGVEKLSDAFANLEKRMLENHLKTLQRNAANKQMLEMSATEAESMTHLSRLRYAIAKETPLGTIGALPELENLQATIRKEMGKLEDLLASIDKSTAGGRIEANKIQGEILQLRLEEKQNLKEFTQGLLSGFVAEAMGASGHFSKLILTQDYGLGAALDHRIYKEFDALTGSVRMDHPKMKPVFPGDILKGLGQKSNPLRAIDSAIGQNKVDQLKNIKKQFERLIDMEEQSNDDSHRDVQDYRQTRTGGRTNLGTK